MKEAKQDAGLLFRIPRDEKAAADFKGAATFGKTPGQSKVRGPVKSGMMFLSCSASLTVRARAHEQESH